MAFLVDFRFLIFSLFCFFAYKTYRKLRGPNLDCQRALEHPFCDWPGFFGLAWSTGLFGCSLVQCAAHAPAPAPRLCSELALAPSSSCRRIRGCSWQWCPSLAWATQQIACSCFIFVCCVKSEGLLMYSLGPASPVDSALVRFFSCIAFSTSLKEVSSLR